MGNQGNIFSQQINNGGNNNFDQEEQPSRNNEI